MKGYKKEMLYESSNEVMAHTIAGWIGKCSRLIKCSVRRKVRKGGTTFVITLRYKTTIRASTLIKIGYNLSTLTEHRVMITERKKPHQGSYTIDEMINRIPEDEISDLPF